jgi:very-short-patch-repair endonuclease
MERLVKYNCDCCGKEFEIKISKYNRKINSKQTYITCSKECKSKMQSIVMSGENNKRYSKVIKICLNCGEEYKINKYKEDISKFCCRECKDKYNANQAIVHIFCDYCGKEIVTLNGKVTRGKRFCSNECAAKAKDTKVTKICVICDREYKTHKRRSESSHTCSKECHSKWLSTVYSQQKDVNNRLKKQGTKTSSQQKTEYTKPELMTLEYFQNHDINFIPQYVINDILIADFFLPDYNCIFEVYGDYWHANPKIYGDGEGLKPLNDMQKKNRQKDIRRYKVIKNKLGYNFYSIWENDIYSDLNKVMEEFFKYINTKIRNDYVS